MGWNVLMPWTPPLSTGEKDTKNKNTHAHPEKEEEVGGEGARYSPLSSEASRCLCSTVLPRVWVSLSTYLCGNISRSVSFSTFSNLLFFFLFLRFCSESPTHYPRAASFPFGPPFTTGELSSWRTHHLLYRISLHRLHPTEKPPAFLGPGPLFLKFKLNRSALAGEDVSGFAVGAPHRLPPSPRRRPGAPRRSVAFVHLADSSCLPIRCHLPAACINATKSRPRAEHCRGVYGAGTTRAYSRPWEDCMEAVPLSLRQALMDLDAADSFEALATGVHAARRVRGISGREASRGPLTSRGGRYPLCGGTTLQPTANDPTPTPPTTQSPTSAPAGFASPAPHLYQREGLGTLYLERRRRYFFQGRWHQNQRHGEGLLSLPATAVEGRWHGGRLAGPVRVQTRGICGVMTVSTDHATAPCQLDGAAHLELRTGCTFTGELRGIAPRVPLQLSHYTTGRLQRVSCSSTRQEVAVWVCRDARLGRLKEATQDGGYVGELDGALRPHGWGMRWREKRSSTPFNAAASVSYFGPFEGGVEASCGLACLEGWTADSPPSAGRHTNAWVYVGEVHRGRMEGHGVLWFRPVAEPTPGARKSQSGSGGGLLGRAPATAGEHVYRGCFEGGEMHGAGMLWFGTGETWAVEMLHGEPQHWEARSCMEA
eukprot:gene12923-8780_t